MLIVGLSVVSCFIYALMLGSRYNYYFYTSLVKLVLFLLVPLLYYSLSKQGRFKDLFRLKGNKKYMKASAFLGGLTFAFIILAFLLLNEFFDKQIILDGLAKEGITKITYPYVFANIVFVNAFLEELFFRGFVFLTVFNLGFKRFSYIFSSVLFSLYHIVMMNSWFSPQIFLLCLAGLIGAGLIFNELDKRCENILGGFFVHLGANLAINLIGVYLLYIK
jgi:membrane protease YdiL (CAAX protease family)